MRQVKLAFLAVLGLVLLTVALANRAPVTVRLLPEEMGSFLGIGWAAELPLYIVIFGSIAAGLLIGFVWEWLREHRHRAAAAAAKREAESLGREVSRLKSASSEAPHDDVLALLDEPRKAG